MTVVYTLIITCHLPSYILPVMPWNLYNAKINLHTKMVAKEMQYFIQENLHIIWQWHPCIASISNTEALRNMQNDVVMYLMLTEHTLRSSGRIKSSFGVDFAKLRFSKSMYYVVFYHVISKFWSGSEIVFFKLFWNSNHFWI